MEGPKDLFQQRGYNLQLCFDVGQGILVLEKVWVPPIHYTIRPSNP